MSTYLDGGTFPFRSGSSVSTTGQNRIFKTNVHKSRKFQSSRSKTNSTGFRSNELLHRVSAMGKVSHEANPALSPPFLEASYEGNVCPNTSNEHFKRFTRLVEG